MILHSKSPLIPVCSLLLLSSSPLLSLLSLLLSILLLDSHESR